MLRRATRSRRSLISSATPSASLGAAPTIAKASMHSRPSARRASRENSVMAEHHPPLAADEAQTLADRVAERMFALDRASQAMGMRIVRVAPGHAELSMTVRADMLNG